MSQVGDRVIVAGTKLGAPSRQGTLLAKVGSMIRVRWSDGSESLFTPGAGSVEYQPSGGSATGLKANGKTGKAAKRSSAKPAGKKASKTKKV